MSQQGVEALLSKFDGDLHMEVGSETYWSGQLRLTLTDPRGAPSRSMTFYIAGESGPEPIMAKLLEDAMRWLIESGVEPMPVPDWMKE